ncbi:MAG: hypothetical protein NTX88_11990 [Candidatus Atribacteria bacterium]|nr:hypothetical protein [Candidatus Atribacteria bacterium]
MRPGIIRDAWDSPWFGAAYHAGTADQDRIVEFDGMLREPIGDWKSLFKTPFVATLSSIDLGG